ncbi:P-loop containing nucleoside triphosphate hydrolase protein [Powellomyces hirtus]|nr:P-loop containing nucleoside triphosphate hydrolase protein [Powellomyces hirtus]
MLTKFQTATVRNLASLREETAHLDDQIRASSPEMSKLKESLLSIDERIEASDVKVREVEQRVFSSFCKSIGVRHVREYEDGQLKMTQEFAEKRMQLETAQAKLLNQLDFEKGKCHATEERLKKLSATIAADEAALEQLNVEKADIETTSEALLKEVDEMTARLQVVKHAVAEKAAVVASMKKEIQRLNKETEGCAKSIAAKDLQIAKLCVDKFSIFRKCKLEEIDLPLLDGSLADISLDQLETAQQNDTDSMDVDEDGGTQTSRMIVQKIRVDFSGLKSTHKEDGSDEAELAFQETLASLSSEIERIAPNMRAIDKLDEVEHKLKDTAKEFDSARKEAKTAKDAFAKVKQERYDLFHNAYTHIRDNIDPIYKELTKSKTFPLGGTAYLSVEDSEEPYNDGIKYHAMPPMKRFRDMELLSGGEKTVAALALLFAIHSYQPAPFFVLDEVDAALDNTNVAKVANYIRRHASDTFQFIVISLKNTFYEKAEALVGIYKDQQRASSRVLTLELDGFLD